MRPRMPVRSPNDSQVPDSCPNLDASQHQSGHHVSMSSKNRDSIMAITSTPSKLESQILDYNDPGLDPSADADWNRFVPMFSCGSMQLLHAEICVRSDEMDDDRKVFEKLRKKYLSTRGFLGRWSPNWWLWDLKGIRRVKVHQAPIYIQVLLLILIR